ncbi:hypothetical protein [Vreelandella venusta]|uniref:hypothetical protein n=1 Tax=Vreelandella venusta TaxID=44935 RepID=UPI002286411A|nr:hypothetical protein [Halomonas venusta]WAM47680.1 hypothetical protein L0521_13005 [Halomonas venusta]
MEKQSPATRLRCCVAIESGYLNPAENRPNDTPSLAGVVAGKLRKAHLEASQAWSALGAAEGNDVWQANEAA